MAHLDGELELAAPREIGATGGVAADAPELDEQLQRERAEEEGRRGLRSNQKSPEAIRRTQTHSDALRRTQTQSDALRRTQTHSDAIRRDQTHSEAIRSDQKRSEAIGSKLACSVSRQKSTAEIWGDMGR